MNTRAVAATVLARVLSEGEFLTAALDATLPRIPQDNDRAFVQALCYGVLRWYWRLDRVLAALTRKPVKDLDVRLLALIGLYQLQHMRVKPHAAVSETVAAAGAKSWAKPLLNGVLRAYQRERERIDAEVESDLAAALAHPAWLARHLARDWPGQEAELMRQNNAAPPLTLRVNLARISREACLAKLAAAGLAAQPVTAAPSAVLLEDPVPVERLPGFAEGELSVQDAAAQLAAPLLDLQAGQRVLDLCAAPGGKTAHILESCAGLKEVVAVDIAPERMVRVRENLARAGLSATVIAADATRPEDWWDGQPFDRILVDAPCSATGVIRRHPDIKVLRRPADIDELERTQSRILEAAWSMLAAGGKLLYATCSVLRRENGARVAAFLEAHPEARERPLTVDWGVSASPGRQVLTGAANMDGFYYALLEKP